MAQDFHSAFGLGQDDRHFTTSDIDGVNMLAIQALIARTDALAKENAARMTRIADLEAALERTESNSSGRR
jgi:hypothetical protein